MKVFRHLYASYMGCMAGNIPCRDCDIFMLIMRDRTVERSKYVRALVSRLSYSFANFPFEHLNNSAFNDILESQ